MSKYEMGYQQQEDLAADARRPATEVGETCECPGGVACSHDGPCEGDVEGGDGSAVYCSRCYCNARAEVDAQGCADWRGDD